MSCVVGFSGLNEYAVEKPVVSLGGRQLRCQTSETVTPSEQQRSDGSCWSDTSVYDGESPAHDGFAADEVPSLNRAQVLQLASDLLEGFSADEFQVELLALRKGAPPGAPVAGLQELALTVQRRILPKYGFYASPRGVSAMLLAVEPFLGDWMVGHLVSAIDEKLGLPAGTTNSQCRSVPKVTAAASEPSLASLLAAPSPRTSSRPPLSRAGALELAGAFSAALDATDVATQLHRGLAQGQASGDGPASVLGRLEIVMEERPELLTPFDLTGNSASGSTAKLAAALRALASFAGDWTVTSKLGEVEKKLGLDSGAIFDAVWDLSQ
eukprot:TRINITY_DN28199_c0_g1_i1.p1 TRINITY_DN28199_c0_g1~~TRINITY_DN28199_c0_g1_i1.p1  ORF type:complete len:325 (-),score=73.76 TRINITY_DN28199_c0_g1_i1:84-1058(-)